MTISYEWDCELHRELHTAGEPSELQMPFSYTTDYRRVKEFIEATIPDKDCEFVAVLVRTDDDNRAWAYVEDGKLPEFFLDAYNSEYRKVPKKFHDEVAKVEGEKK